MLQTPTEISKAFDMNKPSRRDYAAVPHLNQNYHNMTYNSVIFDSYTLWKRTMNIGIGASSSGWRGRDVSREQQQQRHQQTLMSKFIHPPSDDTSCHTSNQQTDIQSQLQFVQLRQWDVGIKLCQTQGLWLTQTFTLFCSKTVA